jgi:hypothetical protein
MTPFWSLRWQWSDVIDARVDLARRLREPMAIQRQNTASDAVSLLDPRSLSASLYTTSMKAEVHPRGCRDVASKSASPQSQTQGSVW